MNLEHFCNNLYDLVGVPVYIYDEKKRSFANFTVPSKLQEIIDGNHSLIINHITEDKISKLTDFSELSYFGFKLNNHKIIIGPYLEKEYLSTTVNGLIKRLKLLNEDQVAVVSFYDSLKVLTRENIDFIINSFKAISNHSHEVTDIVSLVPKKIETSEKISLEHLFEELEYVKENYRSEDQINNIIEKGDVEGAKLYDHNTIMRHLPKRALNDSLRNEKTRLTILNTLSNRAAIKGGIDIQLGHKISTNFGVKIESMSSIIDADRLTNEIIVTYTEAVRDYTLLGYSNLVSKAILSLRRNITEKVTLESLSKELYVTKEHLSRKFKKETNMTVSQYINHSKILEAKKLLRLREYSVSDVSSILSFSNATYFSRVFKAETGQTPQEYRK